MTSDSIGGAVNGLMGSIGGMISTFAPVLMIGVALAIVAGVGLLIVKAIQQDN
jgi:hypothetical protein